MTTYGVRFLPGVAVPNWHPSVTVEDGLPRMVRRSPDNEGWWHALQARKEVRERQGVNIAEAEGTL